MTKPFPLDFAPGFVKVDAPETLRGRYIDGDKVRFKDKKPEKWMGWTSYATVLTGIPRAIVAWDDNSNVSWMAVGTHKKLYIVDSSAVVSNITPYRITGTLALNPFAMVNLSTMVTVTHVAHGETVGSTVNFTGATAAGGITITGDYLVNTVVDADHYTIIHSVAANANVAGGGAAVVYSYELNIGEANVVIGVGFGTGTYGTGTYGTPRTSSNFIIYNREWSLDTYGQNLLAMPSGNNLYQWDPTTPTVRAAKVANSPVGNFMFITNERYPVVLGYNNANMVIAWPDQNDITNWTPSSTSTANTRTLKDGSRAIAGCNLIGTQNVIWTDTAIYTMVYTGARNFVYSTLRASNKCGLIGPHAFAVAGGIPYWMSRQNFFMFTGGQAVFIPNADDIKKWLFDQLDTRQNWKCAAIYSSIHNEVRWQYVAANSLEPGLYVAVSLDDYAWTYGTLNRTAWWEKDGINGGTYATDELGQLYTHEVGHDANGAAMVWFLESAPMDIQDGAVSMNITGYIPNFQRQTGDIQLTIQTWDLPQDTAVMETHADTIAEAQGIVDLDISGRQASVRFDGFSVGGDFRLGVGKIEVTPLGEARGG